jgi:hypothetical protein
MSRDLSEKSEPTKWDYSRELAACKPNLEQADTGGTNYRYRRSRLSSLSIGSAP